MKGFLQRIAASAARLAQPAVHPFVGSVFQSSPWQAAPEEAAMPLGPESVERGPAPIAVPEPVVAERGTDVVNEKPQGERVAAAELKGIERLVPRKAAGVQGPVVPENESKQLRQEDASAPAVLPVTSARREQPPRGPASTHTLPEAMPLMFQPLLPGEMPERDVIGHGGSIAERRSQERWGAVPARTGRRQRVCEGPGGPSSPPLGSHTPSQAMERATSPQPEKHTTEDIEIHIGRVEVVAVPPPTPAPRPAKPIRRSLNLQEYLKRRDGRGS